MSQPTSAKNFSYLGMGKVVSVFFQALFYLLFAALLEPELYGQLSVIVALAGTFATISRLGLNFSLQVYQAKKKSTISDQIKTLFVISTSVASLILIPIDVFAAVLCIGSSFFIMNQQNLLGLRQYKKFMSYSILKSALFFVIPILLFFVLEIPGIVLGMAIASIIGSLPFFKDFSLKSLTDLKKHYKFLIQNYFIDLSGLAILVDKLLISYLFGYFMVGIYQFNLQILIAIGTLPAVLQSYLISEESVGATHRKISYLVVLGSVFLVILVIIISPIFVEIFFTKYSEGVFPLQILVISIIPGTVWAIYSAKLLAMEYTKLGFTSLVNIVSTLALITILGEHFGLMGLSLAVLSSSTIVGIMVYLLYRHESHKIIH